MSSWKFFNKLWTEAESKKDFVSKCYDYWNGKSANPGISGNNEVKNTENVIRQIVECKTTLSLDNMITLQVVPQLGSFEDIKSMGLLQKIADIRNDALTQILKENNFDKFKERAMRWGEIAGFAPAEVVFDAQKSSRGEVVLNNLDPRCVKWDKSAKSIKDVSYFGVEIEMSAQSAKKMYATKDGQEDVKLCEVIDNAAGIKKDNVRGKKGGVISYKDDSGNGGQAYAEQKNNTEGSIKVIKLVRLYLKDDSMYLHTENDSNQETQEKQEWRQQYPHGRMVVFIPNEQFQTILKDDALPKSFSDCFGIAVFNPLDLDTIDGHGEVEPLMFIQERINAAYQRMWWLAAAYVSSILVPNGALELNQGDLVNATLTLIDGIKMGEAPAILTNNTIEQIQYIIAQIEMLEAKALKIARINESMLSGERIDGVTSGEQSKDLKESPMAGIRQIQRNFKDFLTDIGNKCMTLIDEYYDVHRLIKLTTKMDNATYAAFTAEGDQKAIILYDDAGMVVDKMLQNPDWKFQVEVTAGTEVARTRKENAMVIDKLYNEGKLGDPNDPDVLDIYFTAIDLPNRRALVQFIKGKQEAKKPPRPAYDDTEYMKALAPLLKDLEGFTSAKQALLRANDLPDKIDGVADAPIQSITNRGDTMEVANLRAQLGEITPGEPQPTNDELEQAQEGA
jgi:hypothetical protein